VLCLQPNLNKFLAMGRPAWKEARSTLQRILSCMLCLILLIYLDFYGVLLFGFKVLVLVCFHAANEPILRDNDVLRRKSFHQMVSSVKLFFA